MLRGFVEPELVRSGFSGTNVHVIVEEAPDLTAVPTDISDRPLHLLALSARHQIRCLM